MCTYKKLTPTANLKLKLYVTCQTLNIWKQKRNIWTLLLGTCTSVSTSYPNACSFEWFTDSTDGLSYVLRLVSCRAGWNQLCPAQGRLWPLHAEISQEVLPATTTKTLSIYLLTCISNVITENEFSCYEITLLETNLFACKKKKAWQ